MGFIWELTDLLEFCLTRVMYCEIRRVSQGRGAGNEREDRGRIKKKRKIVIPFLNVKYDINSLKFELLGRGEE